MKKKRVGVISLSVLILFAFLFSATPVLPSETKPVELKLAHMFPVGSPSDVHIKAWAEKIASDSNGRLTIRIFPVGTLIAAPELYEGAEKGTTDIAFAFRYGQKGNPLGSAIRDMIISTPDTVTAGRVYDDLWAEFPEEMAAEWDTVKVLWLSPSVIQGIHTSKPVRKLEDMKGLQIRVPSKELGNLVKDLGGTPAFMSVPDFLVGIEKGTVDGALCMPAVVQDNKLGGKIKYFVNISLGVTTPVYCVMNKDVYADLPSDLKKVIDDSCEWGRQGTIKYWSVAFDNALKYYKETGVEVVNLSPQEKERWINIVDKRCEEIGKDLDEKGFPGSKIVSFIRQRVKHFTP
ncbi:MAG: TRAP transporter substrate-binding protein DctP [Deltaproteobacteria bacterium]|nr:TRAP transporter substrate-binding protein DctP [Deltaproteobacteria bacterium]